MIVHKFFATMLCTLVAISTYAQALTEQKKVYTRADTLRGALRPERTCYDVTFYELNLTIDSQQRSISGSNKIVFKTLTAFQHMQIDLYENMQISAIQSAGRDLHFKREFNAVFV